MMLFKHSTPAARDAVFAGTAAEAPAVPMPSEQDLAIAALIEENETLRGELRDLCARWQDELAAAERRARETAAESHLRDDEARLTKLVAALDQARAQFGQDFLALADRSARELAAAALGRLVEHRADEVDWLARIVARRLASLDRQSVVAVLLAPADAEGAIGAEVTARLPQGTSIEVDPALRAGRARLRLQLGNVDIDPAAGSDQLLALLRGDSRDD